MLTRKFWEQKENNNVVTTQWKIKQKLIFVDPIITGLQVGKDSLYILDF